MRRLAARDEAVIAIAAVAAVVDGVVTTETVTNSHEQSLLLINRNRLRHNPTRVMTIAAVTDAEIVTITARSVQNGQSVRIDQSVQNVINSRSRHSQSFERRMKRQSSLYPNLSITSSALWAS
jgi:hypothetical protein